MHTVQIIRVVFSQALNGKIIVDGKMTYRDLVKTLSTLEDIVGTSKTKLGKHKALLFS